ncbi:MAG TPA: hypothetical protein VIY54_12105 [Steroidobacteraceae bacterium]
MRIQGLTQTRLMDESERCIAETARSGTPTQMLVTGRLLAHPDAYQRWECEHVVLMRQVSGHVYLQRQVLALRAIALNLLHRKAIFEYLQERQLTRLQRQRLMALFHSFRDYTASIIAEHGNYLRGASSYWCSHHLAARLMKDEVFAEPLHLYQERYTDYFRVFCDVELAQTDEQKQALEPMRMLRPLLKLQLSEARREILTMPYQPAKTWREVEIRRPTGDTVRTRALGASAKRSAKR